MAQNNGGFGGDGGGDNADFSASNGGELASLGLIDPATGTPTATDDWSPADARQPQGLKGQQGDSPQSGPNVEAPTTPAASGSQWDSDDNPYKKQLEALQSGRGGDPRESAIQTYNSRIQSLRAEGQQAYNVLVSPDPATGQPRMSPEHAKAMVMAAYNASVAQAQRDADRIALGPLARRAAAEQIAKEHGNGRVKAEDIMQHRSPDAMIAAAQTLAKTQRDGSFNQRRQNGTDKVEGAAPSGKALSEAYDNLSPMSKISLGLRRGQLATSA
jgi:hypothetical protein